MIRRSDSSRRIAAGRRSGPASRDRAPSWAWTGLLALLAPGCASAPSVVVLGASFPDWLFCITGGVLATSLAHLVLARRRRLAWLAPAALTYPALTATFAAVAWLVFFGR